MNEQPNPLNRHQRYQRYRKHYGNYFEALQVPPAYSLSSRTTTQLFVRSVNPQRNCTHLLKSLFLAKGGKPHVPDSQRSPWNPAGHTQPVSPKCHPCLRLRPPFKHWVASPIAPMPSSNRTRATISGSRKNMAFFSQHAALQTSFTPTKNFIQQKTRNADKRRSTDAQESVVWTGVTPSPRTTARPGFGRKLLYWSRARPLRQSSKIGTAVEEFFRAQLETRMHAPLLRDNLRLPTKRNKRL